MKYRLFLITILIFSSIQILLAQGQISVKSFRLLPEDLTARVDRVTNDNGQTCALVKIVTTERGFEFDPDGLGMCGSVDESHAGEVWIWVSPGARRLTIRHKQLGVLRGYEYTASIEGGNTYEMVLVTEPEPEEKKNTSNYLALTVSPAEAAVKIDGALVVLNQGQFSKLYPVGQYRYEAFCDLYYPTSGVFDILPDTTTGLNVTLQPNYGFLKVTTSPENGAAVFINGRKVGTTPYTSGRLKSGEYTVQTAMDMFLDASRQVTVSDNQTVEVTMTLAPNFAQPVFACADSDAEIWINGEKKGIGRWSGRLPAGAYSVEARRKSHRSTVLQLTLETGDNSLVTLDAPIPIEGQIDVNSTPFGAVILLDGQEAGTTPKILNHVLVGTHELRIEKTGYTPVTRMVTVEEGKMAELAIDLALLPVENKPVEKNAVTENSPATAGSSQEGGAQTSVAQTSVTTSSPYKRRYRGTNLLFTLNGTYATYPQWSFGFRIGTVRRVGWNISFLSNYRFKGFSAIEPEDGELYAFTSRKNFRMSATAGLLYRPLWSMLLVLNVGYGYRCAYYQSFSDYKYYYYSPHTFQGVDVSLGMILNIRGFVLSAEAETINFKYAEIKFGIGGLFKIMR